MKTFVNRYLLISTIIEGDVKYLRWFRGITYPNFVTNPNLATKFEYNEDVESHILDLQGRNSFKKYSFEIVEVKFTAEV